MQEHLRLAAEVILFALVRIEKNQLPYLFANFSGSQKVLLVNILTNN